MGDSEQQWHSSDAEGLREYFATLDSSILSLYMAISGGNDWGEFYSALILLPLHYRILWLLFITFAIFAVLNIVTGCFVESALQHGQHDAEVIINEELEMKASYYKSLTNLFEAIDENNTGIITIDEFEKILGDERAMAYFHALKLDVHDARTIFTLLD